MVLLALTTIGLEDALRLASEKGASVWCGSDAISEAQYQERSISGLSRFAYPLQGESSDVLRGALETIEEHHPGETVWVEKSL